MGLGFTVGLTLIGAFRELIGKGSIFGANVMPSAYEPVAIFVLAPGAFFVLAMLTAIQNKLKLQSATNVTVTNSSCGGGCSNCGTTCSTDNGIDAKDEVAATKAMGTTKNGKKED